MGPEMGVAMDLDLACGREEEPVLSVVAIPLLSPLLSILQSGGPFGCASNSIHRDTSGPT